MNVLEGKTEDPLQLQTEIEQLRRRVAELERAAQEAEGRVQKLSRELQEARAWQESFFDGARDAILISTPTSGFVAANPAACNLTGYSKSELLAMRESGLYPREELGEHQTTYQRVLQGQPISREATFQRKDGTCVNVAIHSRLVIIHDQLYIISIAQDITSRKEAVRSLRNSTARLKEAQRIARVGDWELDVQERRAHWSAEAARILGLFEGAEPTQATLFQHIHPEDRPQVEQALQAAIEGKQPYDVEYRVLHPHNGERVVHSRAQVIFDRQGHPSRMLGVLQDITERLRTDRALRESEEKFRTLADQSPNMIFINQAGRVVYVNQQCEQVMGYSKEQFYAPDFDFLQLIVPEHRQRVMTNFQAHLRGDDVEPYEYTIITREGERLDVIITTRLINYEGAKAILGIITDISTHKAVERQLTFLATHDALTALPNRIAFNDRLELALAQSHRKGQKLALMLLDLDHFKEVNDSLGHDMGDKLLRVVGERLMGLVRKGDTVARMGGDEFMLLIPEITHAQDVAGLAGKIIDAFHAPFYIDGHRLQITTSIGYTIYPDDGLDNETLKKQADVAMYRAKDNGRDNFQPFIQN